MAGFQGQRRPTTCVYFVEPSFRLPGYINVPERMSLVGADDCAGHRHGSFLHPVCQRHGERVRWLRRRPFGDPALPKLRQVV